MSRSNGFSSGCEIQRYNSLEEILSSVGSDKVIYIDKSTGKNYFFDNENQVFIDPLANVPSSLPVGVNDLIDILATTSLDTISNLESVLSSGNRLSNKSFLYSDLSSTFNLYSLPTPPYMEKWKCCYDISSNQDFPSPFQTIEFNIGEAYRGITLNAPVIGTNYFRVYFKFNKYKTNEEIKTEYSNTSSFTVTNISPPIF